MADATKQSLKTISITSLLTLLLGFVFTSFTGLLEFKNTSNVLQADTIKDVKELKENFQSTQKEYQNFRTDDATTKGEILTEIKNISKQMDKMNERLEKVLYPSLKKNK